MLIAQVAIELAFFLGFVEKFLYLLDGAELHGHGAVSFVLVAVAKDFAVVFALHVHLQRVVVLFDDDVAGVALLHILLEGGVVDAFLHRCFVVEKVHVDKSADEHDVEPAEVEAWLRRAVLVFIVLRRISLLGFALQVLHLLVHLVLLHGLYSMCV